jgi:uncharacterized protein RhaS with RHS repeats
VRQQNEVVDPAGAEVGCSFDANGHVLTTTLVGRRLVREWDPFGGNKRTWHETLDHHGRVRQVRPVTDGPKVHYMFDEFGKFTGSW